MIKDNGSQYCIQSFNNACNGKFTERGCCYDDAAVLGIGREEVDSTEHTPL